MSATYTLQELGDIVVDPTTSAEAKRPAVSVAYRKGRADSQAESVARMVERSIPKLEPITVMPVRFTAPELIHLNEVDA